MTRGTLGLVVAALALGALVACVPVEPRLRAPAASRGAVFLSGPFEEVQYQVEFRVLRPSYLPPGARLREIDYSLRPNDSWAVQRYLVGDRLMYVAAEPGRPITGEPDFPVTILGRPGVLDAVHAPDGSIGEWRVLFERQRVLYTVGGPLPAEELLRVAAGLR